jgi:ABC-type dipeptide/oligopeptide/nickel transport system permease subunit
MSVIDIFLEFFNPGLCEDNQIDSLVSRLIIFCYLLPELLLGLIILVAFSVTQGIFMVLYLAIVWLKIPF